jgi:ABC-type uncharacterized transport system substrate-binding protein
VFQFSDPVYAGIVDSTGDTLSGHVYAGAQEEREACRELGVTLVECHARTTIPDRALAELRYQCCHERLALQVEAMYLTHTHALNEKSVKRLPQPFANLKIPTFAQPGPETVRQGALMGMAHVDEKMLGLFCAQTLAQVVNGAKPRQRIQIFEETPRVAFNISTAKAIGFNAPFETLISAEEIHGENASRAP